MTTTLARTTVVRRRLSFRCARCRGVALAQAEWHDGDNAVVGCGICGQNYVLAASRNRGSGDSQYRDQIRALAIENDLDPATATSVLEEIIPLSRALALRRPVTAPPEAVQTPANGKWMRAAVACVAAVVSIGLLAARRQAAHEGVAPVAPTDPTASVTESGPPGPPPAPSPAPRESPVVSWRDEIGNLTEIAGPDPASVLGGFCREAGGLDPVVVKDSFPPNPGERLGVFRRTSAESGTLTVSIRRDSRTGRWFIGDRRGPIRVSSEHRGAATGSNPGRPIPGGG